MARRSWQDIGSLQGGAARADATDVRKVDLHAPTPCGGDTVAIINDERRSEILREDDRLRFT